MIVRNGQVILDKTPTAEVVESGNVNPVSSNAVNNALVNYSYIENYMDKLTHHLFIRRNSSALLIVTGTVGYGVFLIFNQNGECFLHQIINSGIRDHFTWTKNGSNAFDVTALSDGIGITVIGSSLVS